MMILRAYTTLLHITDVGTIEEENDESMEKSTTLVRAEQDHVVRRHGLVIQVQLT